MNANLASPIIAVLSVVLGTILGAGLTGFTESKRQVEFKKADAIHQLYSVAEGPIWEMALIKKMQQRQNFTIYGSPEAIKSLAESNRAGCDRSLDERSIEKCLDLEISLIEIIRHDIGADPVPREDIKDAIGMLDTISRIPREFLR